MSDEVDRLMITNCIMNKEVSAPPSIEGFYRTLADKDAEIERLKDLARRLARGWDCCRCWEFGEPISFGEEPIWDHWDMVKDPEVLALFTHV